MRGEEPATGAEYQFKLDTLQKGRAKTSKKRAREAEKAEKAVEKAV